jgi:hypothetical protein
VNLGQKIGSGGSRIVYAGDPGYVVKVPNKGNRKHYNLIEAMIWEHAPDDLRQWLVPVIDCHPDGDWLIMLRGEPIADDDRPKLGHRAMHDWRKIENWVRLGDKVLLCDYAHRHMAKAIGLKPPRSRDCA